MDESLVRYMHCKRCCIKYAASSGWHLTHCSFSSAITGLPSEADRGAIKNIKHDWYFDQGSGCKSNSVLDLILSTVWPAFFQYRTSLKKYILVSQKTRSPCYVHPEVQKDDENQVWGNTQKIRYLISTNWSGLIDVISNISYGISCTELHAISESVSLKSQQCEK